MKIGIVAVSLSLFMISSASAKTWWVDASGGGDFLRIQAAVNAAVDGDLILVRPTGTYGGFNCSKGVTIRAESGQFEIGQGETIRIRNTLPGQRTALSGVYVTFDLALKVESCQGEVVIENVDTGVVVAPFFNTAPSIFIDACANVSISDVSVDADYSDMGGGNIYINNSSVRMSQVTSEAGRAATDGDPADAACYVVGSYVEIAQPDFTGAEGEEETLSDPAGDGGPGLHAQDSTLVIVGDPNDTIRGGNGGVAVIWAWCGDGGDGLVMNSSVVEISRVALVGGSGGGGLGSCSAGISYSGGTPSRNDSLPHLTLTDDLSLGDGAQATVTGLENGLVYLMISDVGGFVPVPKALGPRLSVIPGPGFLFFGVGPTSNNVKSVPFVIPGDPTLIGWPLNMQAFFVGSTGNSYLTNSVTRILGQ